MKLDGHVAGVDPEELKLNRAGEHHLSERLDDLIGNPFSKLLVADHGDGSDIVAMGDIALWHHAEHWRNPERQGMSYALIDDVWVEPALRRSGLGTAIIDQLLDFAAKNGIDDLVLEYSVTNAEAAAAWTKLGFETTGVRAAASLGTVRRRLRGRGRRAKNTETET